MEFSRENNKNSMNHLLILNSLVGLSFEGIEEIEETISMNLSKDVKLKLNNIITDNFGPIYEYFGELEKEIDIKVYIGDYENDHTISAIVVGHNATYKDEKIKNIIKGSVN